MSVRTILLWPDARLSQVCARFDGSDATVIKDLLDTMYQAKGRGLAAPQIGVLQRVFVVDVTWKEAAPEPRVFVDPVLVSAGHADMRSGEEQCLSIPNLPMQVERPHVVQLEWTTPEGQRISDTFDGILARCIQHELDHLDGRVILDHQTPEGRAALEAVHAG